MTDLESHGVPVGSDTVPMWEQLSWSDQNGLWREEDPAYLSRQIITYLGNKRSLLGHIGTAIAQVKKRLGKNKLRLFDIFSGSGIVSRFFKSHASHLISNDIEEYAAILGRCYLQNRSGVDLPRVAAIVADLNDRVTHSSTKGFIEDLYAPKDEQHISKTDRVFYTKENARRLDTYRRLIDEVPDDVRDLLLASLLHKASVHANTAGVFKGFYKNRHTGVGQYGGTSADALQRIRGQIVLEVPVLSRFECDYVVSQQDANTLVREVAGVDLAYIDPPYNQHPYGSNYFMLNLLVQYQRPMQISKVSGIPKNWHRSGYNSHVKALPLLRHLLEEMDARYLLLSFNNEGFINPKTLEAMLASLGTVETVTVPYNTFRGCRNLRQRSIHVTEQLFLVEKK